jgi:hypothetical protein
MVVYIKAALATALKTMRAVQPSVFQQQHKKRGPVMRYSNRHSIQSDKDAAAYAAVIRDIQAARIQRDRGHFEPTDIAEHERGNGGEDVSDYCAHCRQPFLAHNNGQCPRN